MLKVRDGVLLVLDGSRTRGHTPINYRISRNIRSVSAREFLIIDLSNQVVKCKRLNYWFQGQFRQYCISRDIRSATAWEFLNLGFLNRLVKYKISSRYPRIQNSTFLYFTQYPIGDRVGISQHRILGYAVKQKYFKFRIWRYNILIQGRKLRFDSTCSQ